MPSLRIFFFKPAFRFMKSESVFIKLPESQSAADNTSNLFHGRKVYTLVRAPYEDKIYHGMVFARILKKKL